MSESAHTVSSTVPSTAELIARGLSLCGIAGWGEGVSEDDGGQMAAEMVAAWLVWEHYGRCEAEGSGGQGAVRVGVVGQTSVVGRKDGKRMN